MRTNKWHLLWVLALPLFLFMACNEKNSNNPVPQEENDKTPVLLGQYAPHQIEGPENGIVKVGFMQSARVFTLDARATGASEYLKALKAALKNEVPVKVEIYEGTNEIARVSDASADGVRLYKASLSQKPAVVTKETLPIIPSETALNNLFAAVNTSSIPFAYAVDGCYARAHKMRQIIVANGYECAKLFAYGSNLAARSLGGCCVVWSYHVAPLVRYRTASGSVELAILDPALFTGPVSQATWLNKVRDNTCQSGANVSSTFLAYGNVYVRGSNGSVIYDDNLQKTDCIISNYSGLSGCSTNPPTSSNYCWPPYMP
jgi:hypothetical protein